MKNKVTISLVDMQERAELGIRSGDTVRVWIRIEEKGKTRLQAFEGLVLARKHGDEAGGTFTVRKVASGVGVERIFPLYSPIIDKIEIVKRAKMRRAKLYFLRDKVAREVRRALRRTKIMGVSTKGLAELEEERKRAEVEEVKRQEEEIKRAEEEAKAEQEKAEQEEVKEENPTTPEDSKADSVSSEDSQAEETKEGAVDEDKKTERPEDQEVGEADKKE